MDLRLEGRSGCGKATCRDSILLHANPPEAPVQQGTATWRWAACRTVEHLTSGWGYPALKRRTKQSSSVFRNRFRRLHKGTSSTQPGPHDQERLQYSQAGEKHHGYSLRFGEWGLERIPLDGSRTPVHENGRAVQAIEPRALKVSSRHLLHWKRFQASEESWVSAVHGA